MEYTDRKRKETDKKQSGCVAFKGLKKNKGIQDFSRLIV
jgi:hypothetical protein